MAEQMQQILSDFGRSLGIDRLAFDTNGYCCLGFDEIVVNLELVPKAGQLMFYTQIGFAPRPATVEWCEALLAANHFFRGTGGTTLGMDPDSRSVVLVYALSLEGLSLTQFEAELQGFVDIAERWTRKLAQPGVPDLSGTQSAGFGGGFSPIFDGMRV